MTTTQTPTTDYAITVPAPVRAYWAARDYPGVPGVVAVFAPGRGWTQLPDSLPYEFTRAYLHGLRRQGITAVMVSSLYYGAGSADFGLDELLADGVRRQSEFTVEGATVKVGSTRRRYVAVGTWDYSGETQVEIYGRSDSWANARKTAGPGGWVLDTASGMVRRIVD